MPAFSVTSVNTTAGASSATGLLLAASALMSSPRGPQPASSTANKRPTHPSSAGRHRPACHAAYTLPSMLANRTSSFLNHSLPLPDRRDLTRGSSPSQGEGRGEAGTLFIIPVSSRLHRKGFRGYNPYVKGTGIYRPKARFTARESGL